MRATVRIFDSFEVAKPAASSIGVAACEAFDFLVVSVIIEEYT
jgi:hypothetical protein